jgi:hypothetical protein
VKSLKAEFCAPAIAGTLRSAITEIVRRGGRRTSEIRQKMRPVLVLDQQKRPIGRRSVDITG